MKCLIRNEDDTSLSANKDKILLASYFIFISIRDGKLTHFLFAGGRHTERERHIGTERESEKERGESLHIIC